MWKNIYFKISLLCLVLASTLLYAQYSRKQVYKLVANYGEGGMILKALPIFETKEFKGEQLVNRAFFINKPHKGFLFHFWANLTIFIRKLNSQK